MTKRDERELCWFETRVLLAQAQHKMIVDEINSAIRGIQLGMGAEKDKKSAIDKLMRQLKTADNDFYGRV